MAGGKPKNSETIRLSSECYFRVALLQVQNFFSSFTPNNK